MIGDLYSNCESAIEDATIVASNREKIEEALGQIKGLIRVIQASDPDNESAGDFEDWSRRSGMRSRDTSTGS